MVVALALRIVAFLVIVVMVMVVLRFERFHMRLQRVAALDRLHKVCAGKLIPRRGNDRRFRVQLAHHVEHFLQALLAYVLRTAQNHAVRGLDLVHVKLAEVLAIDARLLGVDDRDAAVDDHVVGKHAADRALDVRKLAHAGRLDEDAVRMELVQHFFERFGKIADERAADAAGVHLRDLNARFL